MDSYNAPEALAAYVNIVHIDSMTWSTLEDLELVKDTLYNSTLYSFNKLGRFKPFLCQGEITQTKIEIALL